MMAMDLIGCKDFTMTLCHSHVHDIVSLSLQLPKPSRDATHDIVPFGS